MTTSGHGTRRSPASGALALGVLVAAVACGGDRVAPDDDGWVPISEGDTYGEWQLFAQVDDTSGEERWTGCLRLDHVQALVERCTEPDGSPVVFANDVANIGAVPSDVAIVFGDGDEVPTDGADRGLGVEFFVVAGDVFTEDGTPVRVAGASDALRDVAEAFEGSWVADGDRDCAATNPALTLDEIVLTPTTVTLTTSCGAGGAPLTCRGGYVLVGSTSEGDEVSTLLRPTSLDCDDGGPAVEVLGLDTEDERLLVDSVATFVRS